MRYAVPGPVRYDDRPPVATDAAPRPGTACRISASCRAVVNARIWPDTGNGIDPTHPYVRRYWSAAIGPSAVADLLRLIAAARKGSSLPHPLYLHVLVTEHLALHLGSYVLVRERVPLLAPRQVRTLPPWLRVEHAQVVEHLEAEPGAG